MTSKASDHVLSLSLDDFDREVLESGVPVLVDFYADWCPPCRAIAPVIDALAVEYAGRVKVAKVNTDAEGDLSTRYGISSIPSVLLFKDGELVERLVGLRSRDEYVSAIEAGLG